MVHGVAQGGLAGEVADAVAFREVLGADDNGGTHGQIMSAKDRSVRRKYHTPVSASTTAQATVQAKLCQGNSTPPPKRLQRKASITPVMGFNASRSRQLGR